MLYKLGFFYENLTTYLLIIIIVQVINLLYDYHC